MDTKEIFIIVEGGMVTNVVGPAGLKVNVTVLDCDTQDPDELDQIDDEIYELFEDVNDGSKTILY